MIYSKEIVPCYDAAVYLSQRFTKNRASARIKELPTLRSIDTNGVVWKKIEKIAELERKLDERFEPDELMLRYFSPLQTVNSLSSQAISFGELLLFPKAALKEPVGYDSIADFYISSSQETIISQFSTHLFSAFAPDEQHSVQSINELVALADKILIKLDDKWLFIDLVLNPLQHLEKLRPLVCAVAEAIVESAVDFDELLGGAMNSIESVGTPERVLKTLNLDFKPKEMNAISIHPSLTSFNMVSMCASPSAADPEKKDIQLFLGIYVYFGIAEKMSEAKSPDAFLYTLKLISDPTRFSMLHDLCDKHSYGQELAQSFNCTRSAMYYHLEKLTGNRLIDQEITGYRMLYTLNKRNVYDRFNAMRDYILNGWKPEDEEGGGEDK